MSEQQIARLKRTNGEIIAEVPLPTSAAELPLVRYLSFLVEMRKFELEGANPMQIMAQAVAEISGVDVADVLRAKVGETWQEDKQLDGGVRSLYGWYVRVIASYRGEVRNPETFAFKYGGDAYHIPFAVSSEIAGGLPMLPAIEAGEAVEAMETIRLVRQQIADMGDPKGERKRRIGQLKEAIVKQGDTDGVMMKEIKRLEAEAEIDGDPNGNLIFSQYLRLVAILARKEGEKLPASDGERERWIQDRAMKLQGIDTQTALDVDFFLIGLLTLSKRTHPVIGSLILPCFALGAATQSREQPKKKPTIERYRTSKKFKKGSVIVPSFKLLSKKTGLILPD
jgi:hypothetical protein